MASGVEFSSTMDKKDYEKGIDWAVDRALAMAGITIESAAIQQVPVDTGRLKASISWATKRHGVSIVGSPEGVTPPSVGNVVYIGTNVEYAPYVEYGTRRRGFGALGAIFNRSLNTGRMRAKPFLRPALKNNKRQIVRIFQQWVKEGLERGK